ncbi:MAG: hypothetical protein ACYC1D_14455 [Acidimicrobiales bacterium]
MTIGDWTNFGGDPAPGDPASAYLLARTFGDIAGTGSQALSTVHSINARGGDPAWEAPSATAFHPAMPNSLPGRRRGLMDVSIRIPAGPAGPLSLAACPRPISFWLALPNGWTILDVDPATAPRTMGVLFERAIAAYPPAAALREAGMAGFQNLLDESVRAGVRFAAVCATPVDDDVLAEASLTVAFNRFGPTNDPVELMAEVAGIDPEREVGLWQIGEEVAIRRVGLSERRLVGRGDPVRLLDHQYYVPILGTEADVALISLASPTWQVWQELREGFDAVASTFAFVWADWPCRAGRHE